MFNSIIARVQSELKASITNRAKRKGLQVIKSKVIYVTYNFNMSIR